MIVHPVFCRFPLIHNQGSQKPVVPTCKQTAHLVCAFPSGLGCNLISISSFWIIDIDATSRNDYEWLSKFHLMRCAISRSIIVAHIFTICVYACAYVNMLVICHTMIHDVPSSVCPGAASRCPPAAALCSAVLPDVSGARRSTPDWSPVVVSGGWATPSTK